MNLDDIGKAYMNMEKGGRITEGASSEEGFNGGQDSDIDSKSAYFENHIDDQNSGVNSEDLEKEDSFSDEDSDQVPEKSDKGKSPGICFIFNRSNNYQVKKMICLLMNMAFQ